MQSSTVVRPSRDALFTLQPLETSHRDTFVELVTAEIGKRYPETGEPYATALWTAHDGHLLPIFGTHTLRKRIYGLYRFRDLLGFTVATEKSGGRVKFGPSIVLSRHRNAHVATTMRLGAEELYRRRGFWLAYSTCRSDNAPARRYVERAGYVLTASLRQHYVSQRDELVFTKCLGATALPSPAAGGPLTWSIKRGGAVQVLWPADRDPCTEENLEELLGNAVVKCARRKISVIAAAARASFDAFRRCGFSAEARLPFGAVLFSRFVR